MKKKILTFMLSLCFILTCAFLFSACGKEPGKEPVSVTIDFSFNQDHYATFTEGEYWEVDETTNTFTTTYMYGFAWDGYLFNVVATTENGDTKNLYEATDSNPMGYKIDTNMPENDGRLPAGTYTFRLYCEDFDNGQYKVEACESETYTIIIEKETIELEGGWQYNTSLNVYNGEEIQVSCDVLPYYIDGSAGSLGDVGIKNFNIVENSDYTCRAINAGDYTAKVEYEADTANFNYVGDGLPEKEFEWSIEKGNVQHLMDSLWVSYGTDRFEYEYGSEVTPIYSFEEFAQKFTNQNVITLTGVKVNGVLVDSYPLTFSAVGTYTVTPVIVQNDTENYEIVDYENSEYSRTWTITKKKLQASNFVWSGYIEPYNENRDQEVYFTIIDGSIQFEYVTDITNNITNKARNAGVYTAKVNLIYDSNSYEIVGEPQLEYEWEIKKAEILCEVYWVIDSEQNINTTMYSGLDKTPECYISGCTTVVKHYDSQGNELTGEIVNIGKYKSVVTDISGYDKDNYELKLIGSTEFEWQINYKCLDSWDVEIDDGAGYTSQYRGWDETLEATVVPNGKLTVDFKAENITPENDFTFKFSLDGGETFVEESAIELDVSVENIYVITVVAESENAELLEFIDESLLTLTIIIQAE